MTYLKNRADLCCSKFFFENIKIWRKLFAWSKGIALEILEKVSNLLISGIFNALKSKKGTKKKEPKRVGKIFINENIENQKANGLRRSSVWIIDVHLN